MYSSIMNDIDESSKNRLEIYEDEGLSKVIRCEAIREPIFSIG